MSTNHIRNLMAGVVLSCLMTPLTGLAHEPVNPLHTIPIETVDSRLASPTNIHVQVTDQGVEVKGKLKRKGHKNQMIRGHVDVELVGENGQVLESETLSIIPLSGPSKHDHDRDFTLVLPQPVVKDYSVRVRHNIGMDDHAKTK